jgi:GGDEF domain-containing protein
MPLVKLQAEALGWETLVAATVAARQAAVEEITEEVPPEAEEAKAPAEEVQPESPMTDSKVVEMPRSSHARVDEEEALAVPGGIRRPEVLNELLRSEATFQGVTLSISVVDYVRLVAEHGKEPVEQVMGALEGLVQSSGNPADLVCRISEDEFIVVCPGATGAAATNRVQQLSENLWDFQLRSLVSFPILFSWGASESGLMPGMPRVLADSVDRAREQMLETRRSRRALTWESAKYGLRSSAG